MHAFGDIVHLLCTASLFAGLSAAIIYSPVKPWPNIQPLNAFETVLMEMDRDQIKSENIVERYLSGDLLVREARDFERFCLEHPEVLATLPIPARVKTQLSLKQFDGNDTSVFDAMPSSARIAAATGLQTLKPDASKSDKPDDDEDDYPAARSSGASKALLVLLLAALASAGALFWQTQTQQKQIKSLSVSAKALKLQAPGEVNTLRIVPSDVQLDSPNVSVSLNQAQLLDIHLDVSNLNYSNYGVTIDKVNEARVLQVRRIEADTNKEVRFSLNSSAFGAGDYEIKLEGYNYKGQVSDAGWVLIAMQ